MPITQKESHRNPWAAAGMAFSGIALAGLCVADALVPDVTTRTALKFSAALPNVSGSVLKIADPNLGIKKIDDLTLSIQGRRGELYRIKVRGDQPAFSNELPTDATDPDPVYYDSGDILFAANGVKTVLQDLNPQSTDMHA